MTLFFRSALFAAALAVAAPAFAQDDPVVARVNGVDVRQSDLNAAEEDLGQNAAQIPPEAKRDYLITYVADMLIVAQAAEAKKLGDTPDFKRKIAILRNKLLMEQLLTTEAKAAATDEALKKVYEEAVKQLGQEEEVSARHILFRVADAKDEKASKEAEEKTKAVVERLKKGEDFVKLAKELTEDPSGKDNGGDLGFFTKDQMVPEFSEAAFKMEKGQISAPIKSDFGWHVIKVEDKRKKPAPNYEQVKDQVESFVVRRAQAEMIGKLRAEAKVEKLDKDGKPIPAEPKK